MDKALKQRLVGATVLVALAVVILPMLLGGQTDAPQGAREIDIPQRPQELSFETRRFPIGEQQSDQPSVLPESAPESVEAEPVIPLSPPASDGEDGTLANATANEAAESPAEPSEVEAGATAIPQSQTTQPPPLQDVVAQPSEVEARDNSREIQASPGGRYLVQVASFSSMGNANRLADTLRSSGLTVVMDSVESAAGTLRRVRVGPFEQASRAESVVAQINRQLPDLRPRVVDLRPTEESTVTQPEDPLIQWMVQVGSFTERENADQLVFQLRDAGFRASSVAVSDSRGTAFKVRVGPEVRRSDAVRLKDRLATEQGIDGLVLSID